MADTDFVFMDEVPEAGNPAPVSELSCKKCGTPLTYSGRGRKPTMCDDCKPSRSASTSTGKSTALVSRAISELEMVYGVGGQALKYADKIAGELVYQNRAELAESWRLVLETNKRVRDLFAKIEGNAAWLPLITVHANLIASIWFAHGVAHLEQTANNDVQS